MSDKTPGQKREENLELLKRLRPIDDIFMREIFRNNKELTEFVLRTITGIPDLEVTEIHSQYDMQRLMGARSLCLDVFARDGIEQWYNLEVQRSENGAEPRRARYHSSSIDVETLDAGADFKDLPITYVIFVTETDVFGEGKLIYPIERINTATGKPFNDGEHIIYVNGEYSDKDDNSDLAKLMHDFCCSNADDMLLPIMAENTRYYKTNRKGVEHMSKYLDEWIEKLVKMGEQKGEQVGIQKGRQEGRQEGIQEGEQRQAAQTARRMIEVGKYTLEEIAACSNLPLDEVKALAEDNRPATT